MECNEFQKQQIEVLLGYAFNELQQRCSQRDLKAIASLAYACHNLPTAYRNPHFDIDYFYKCFERFHDEHGYMYDYVAMLDAVRDAVAITVEVATGRWGTGIGERPEPT